MTDKFGDFPTVDEASQSNVTRLPLTIRPARLVHPSLIPPRPWLYGTILMRGFITVTVAPGGVGKSQLAMAMAMASAVGKPILGHHIHHQVNSWIFNLEDPLDEMDRRLAALMIRHDIAPEELENRMFMNSGRERALTIAKLSPDGTTVVFPDKDAILKEGRAAKIGHLVVDPYVRSHELDENSNTQQAAAAAAWAQIAEELNAAVHLVHHTRKGAVTDIDASRGAKALTDHARSGLILSSMPEEEAGTFGIPKEKRYAYIRLDDAKSNMAPRADKANWFFLDPVQLHNGTPDYPNGDSVTAIVPWTPPSVFEGVSQYQIDEVLDRITDGFAPGVPYSPNAQGANNKRWVGTMVMDQLTLNKEQVKRILATWSKNGVLEEFSYHDEATRKDQKGVKVNEAKRPGISI